MLLVLKKVARPFAAFAQDERGAVAADYVFMTSAVTAAGFAVLSTISQGVEDISGDVVLALSDNDIVFASQNFGRDRLTVLLAGERSFFSENAMRTRYNIFSDPDQRTDRQVRNAHRTWSRRMADTSYSQPDRAEDMVRILEMALDARELEPHDNI